MERYRRLRVLAWGMTKVFMIPRSTKRRIVSGPHPRIKDTSFTEYIFSMESISLPQGEFLSLAGEHEKAQLEELVTPTQKGRGRCIIRPSFDVQDPIQGLSTIGRLLYASERPQLVATRSTYRCRAVPALPKGAGLFHHHSSASRSAAATAHGVRSLSIELR